MNRGIYLYIHVPVCTGRCGYCDFYSTVPDRNPSQVAEEVLCLAAEELVLLHREEPAIFDGQPLCSVFFGGGSPSLASPSAFRSFLQRVQAMTDSDLANAEITLETQPGTCDLRKLNELVAAGMNRFSVGVQSFDETHLHLAGRRHTLSETRILLNDVKSAGARLSMDLISCWPGQTVENWRLQLEEALSFAPEHISVYELTFHGETPFTRKMERGELPQSDESLREELFLTTRGMLTAAGFEHYEISNFALPGCRSRHNENYWKLGDYAGLGAGAHSLIGGHRRANPDDLSRWSECIRCGKTAYINADTSDKEITLLENLQMVLRLSDGINMDVFSGLLGMDIRQTHAQKWVDLQNMELLDVQGNHAKLTLKGQLQLDTLIEYLI